MQAASYFVLFKMTESQARFRQSRKAGKKAHGRPSVLNDKIVSKIRTQREEGASLRAIARNEGISLGTVQNALATDGA